VAIAIIILKVIGIGGDDEMDRYNHNKKGKQ